jgi:dephospho-CoA kinase
VTKITSAEKFLRIGLTGGIASGKSVAADMFSRRDIPVIDTDQIAREVVAPGEPGLKAVVSEFGNDFVRPDGSLDRALLRTKIFSDPHSRKRLEAILHPLIRAATFNRAQNAGGPYQIIAVPLLAETNFGDFVDRILVIDCPLELCRERLMARDNESEESVDRIFSAQASRARRLEIADDVIVNDSTLEDMERALEELHKQYLEISAAA